MSTKAKLNKLLKTKADIKKAIQNKGGNVGEIFDEYPAAITSLRSGKLNVKDLGLKFAYSKTSLDDITDNFDFTGVEDFNLMFYTEYEVGHNSLRRYIQGGSFTFPDSAKTANSCFYGGRALDKIDVGNAKLESCNGALSFAKEIDYRDMPFGDGSYMDSAFSIKGWGLNHNSEYCLKDLTIKPFNNPNSNFYNCGLLSRESVLNIINSAEVVEGDHILYLNQNSVNQLTDEEIAIATNKGWTVTPAKKDVVVITNENKSELSDVSVITPTAYDLRGVFSTQYINAKVLVGELGSDVSAGSSLQYLDVTVLNTVTSLSFLGHNGGAPKEMRYIDIKGDFSNVTSMYYLFGNVSTLYPTTIDVSNWDLSSCTNFTGTFTNTTVTPVGYENWNIRKDANIVSLFNYSLLETIDLSNWKDLTSIRSFALNCPNLVELKCPSGMASYEEVRFQNNPKLKKLDASMITQECKDSGIILVGSGTFSNCTSLEELKLPTYYKRSASSTHSFACAFYNCKSLKEIDFTGAPVGDISYAFVNCKSLKKIIMPTAPSTVNERTFEGINPYGTFYYDPQYDYSNVFNYLPSTWKRVPITQ